MIHRKARSLMGSGEVIARLAAQAASDASAQQTRPTGSVATHASDGTVTVTGPILAPQGGSAPTQATHVGDTVAPGVPTGILISSASSLLTVHWNGSLDGGVPGDFSHITIYVDPAVNGSNILGQMSTAGDLVSSGVIVGSTYTISATSEDDVCNMDGTPAHNVSDKVTVGSVLIEALSAEDKEARDSAEAAKKLAQESKDAADAANSSATDAKQTAQDAKDLASSTANTVKPTVQHFFYDNNGVHVSTDTTQNGSKNILMNSAGILLRNLQSILMSLTASGLAIYDGIGNAASNIVAQFSSSNVTIGKTTDSNTFISSLGVLIRSGLNNLLSATSSGISIYDGKGNTDSNITAMFKNDRIELGHNNTTDNHITVTPSKISFLSGTREMSVFTPSNITLGNQLSNSVSISNSDMAINNGGQRIAVFNKNSVSLGANSDSAKVTMCNSSTEITAEKYDDSGIDSMPPTYGSVITNNDAGIIIERVHTLNDKEAIGANKRYLGYTLKDRIFIENDESRTAASIGFVSSFIKPNEQMAGNITAVIQRDPSFPGYNNLVFDSTEFDGTHKHVAIDLSKVIDCLNAANTTMTDWVYLYGSSANGNVINTIKYKAINGICYMTFDLTGIPTNGWYCPTKLPTQYLPDTASYIGATDYPSGAAGLVWLVSKSANGSGPWFMNTGSGRLVGTISWPY